MYVSKFQRYGGAAIVVVLAVAVGAGMLPGSIDRQTSLVRRGVPFSLILHLTPRLRGDTRHTPSPRRRLDA